MNPIFINCMRDKMCDKNGKKLCTEDACQDCFNKSFASCDKARFWSNQNNATTREVTKGSHKKRWFNCDICDHEFEVSLNNITSSNSWCPYCANNKLCSDEDCAYCFDKSFTDTDKARFWSNKNNITSRLVFKNSNKKYWFNCNICNHEFEVSLNNVTSSNRWCPYCANKKLCLDEDCAHCFDKSFAENEKSIYWSVQNNIHPRETYLKVPAKNVGLIAIHVIMNLK